MVGLPNETTDDIQAIVDLTQKVKKHFLGASKPKSKIGQITISVNCFVPKPVTPFQWCVMDEKKSLKKKLSFIENELRPIPNVRVHTDNPQQAYIQSILSRGDRRMADMLVMVHKSDGNWNKALKEFSDSFKFDGYRKRSFDEILPWDFINHGVEKGYLIQEYQKAIQMIPTSPCPTEQRCHRCGVCA